MSRRKGTDHGGYSVSKTAQILGMTPNRVRRIEAEALDKISAYLKEKGIGFDDLLD